MNRALADGGVAGGGRSERLIRHTTANMRACCELSQAKATTQ